MDIKTKERELIYLSCIIFSELDKIDTLILKRLEKSPYYEMLKNIIELKKKWIDLALE